MQDSNQPDQEETKRQQFIASKEAEIQKAVKAKRFATSEDGSIVLDLLQEQMNGCLKKIAGIAYKDDHAGYLYELGKLHQAQYLQNMLTREANKDVEQLKVVLDAAKSE